MIYGFFGDKSKGKIRKSDFKMPTIVSTIPFNFTSGCAFGGPNKFHIVGGESSNNATNHYSWDGTNWVQESVVPFNFYAGSVVWYEIEYHFFYRNNHYALDLTGVTPTWRNVSTLPFDFVGRNQAVVYDGKIHILGGYDSPHKNHYAWDGSNWSKVSTLPYSLNGGSAVVYDGKIHIISGNDGRTKHYCWDGVAWKRASVMDLMDVAVAGGYAFVYDDAIHVLNGWSNHNTEHLMWNGDKIDGWKKLSPLPYSYTGGAVLVLNDTIQILGGGSAPTRHYKLELSGLMIDGVGEVYTKEYIDSILNND